MVKLRETVTSISYHSLPPRAPLPPPYSVCVMSSIDYRQDICVKIQAIVHRIHQLSHFRGLIECNLSLIDMTNTLTRDIACSVRL
jgi:hypothetical protein